MAKYPLLPIVLLVALSLAADATEVETNRDALIHTFTEKPTGTVPVGSYTGQIRQFTLEVHRIQTEISPGVKVEQWAFAFPGQAPTVPGPELRVTVGDLVRITLVNRHDQPHTIHPHGITTVAQEMDGVPHTSFVVLPGKSYTYEFVARDAGTHAYHCHQQTNLHLDMGMYGALIVEPAAGTPVPWKAEHTLILDEWASRQDPNDLKHDIQPDLFLVNGKTFPWIDDVQVPEGQVDLLRVIHMGAQPHSLHLHGLSFLVIAKDGYPLPAPYEADTLPIHPGERYDLLVKGRDGAFPFHDHNTPNNVNLGVYPGGQHFMLTGGPARRADGSLAPDASGHPHSMTSAEPAAHHGPSSTPAAAQTSRPDSGPPSIPEHAKVIDIREFEYSPAMLTIARGETVSWRNHDAVAHHVVLNIAGQVETLTLAPHAVASITFTHSGTFTYHCLPHPFMKGTIEVR